MHRVARGIVHDVGRRLVLQTEPDVSVLVWDRYGSIYSNLSEHTNPFENLKTLLVTNHPFFISWKHKVKYVDASSEVT